MTDTPIVSPDAEYPTHHLMFDDGTDQLGLILCDRGGNPSGLSIRELPTPATVTRISQGSSGYGDFEAPYTPMVQRDWSGGRGLEDLEEDTTRYTDANVVDTRRPDGIVNGPKAFSSPSLSSVVQSQALESETFSPFNDTYYTKTVAYQFTAATKYVSEVEVSAIYDGADPYTTYLKMVSIWSGASTPETKLVEVETYLTPYERLPLAVSLVVGNKYWIVISSSTSTVNGLSMKGTSATAKIMTSSNTTWGSVTWTLSALQNKMPYFKFYSGTSGRPLFFEYRRSVYAVINPEDGSAPQLYRNGLRGMAQDNSANLGQLKTGLTITENLTGKIAQIVSGPGLTEEQNWRLITGASGGTIEVSPPWNVAHTTSTEFAILGQDEWYQVSGHGLTATVTDVLAVDHKLYFAQGESVNIRRGRLINDVWEWADDGTNKASHIKMIPDKKGVRKIWRSLATAGTVAEATVPGWGTNLTFGNSITCKDNHFRINNIRPYSSPVLPYVLKEDCFGSVSEGVWAQIPLYEMETVRSHNNGRAAVQFGVYLIFGLQEGVQRYYQGRLDSIGPDRDLGLPNNRQGPVQELIAYPTGVFGCVDAGSGYSSILFWNQLGWCELYRSAMNSPIYSAFVQVLPGRTVDRLWFMEKATIKWIPLSFNPLTEERYYFTDTGTIESARLTGSLREIVKYWSRIKVFSENLAPDVCWLELAYKTDTDADWITVTDSEGNPVKVTQSPSQEVDISPNFDVVGRWFRYKMTLRTADDSISPRVKAVVVDAVTRIPAKRAWSITFKVSDNGYDLNGDMLMETAETQLAKIRDWVDSRMHAAPVVMREQHGLFDNIRVFIDPPSLQPLSTIVEPDRSITLICSVTVREA